MGVRYNTGLISIIVALTTPPSTASILWTKSTLPGRVAVIRKLMYRNRTGGVVSLRIGYNTNAVVPAFVQVAPDILATNGVDGELTEAELPIMGNTVVGFATDATVTTGTLGNIMIGATASAAAPNDVQVMAEIEEM